MIPRKYLIKYYPIMLLSISLSTQTMESHPVTRGAKRKLAELETIKSLTPKHATQKLQTFIKKHRIFPSNPYTLAELNTIIAQGANVNTAVNKGTTALMRAAAYGNLDALKALLQAGADVNTKSNIHRYTALESAISYDRTAAVQLLIDAGANPTSALSHAVVHRHCPNLAIIQTLLDAGANPKERMRFSRMTIADFVLIESGTYPAYKKTWQLFTQKYPDLHLTSQQATQELQAWINSSGSPFRNRGNETTSRIRKLIAFEADITIRSVYGGATPFMCAARDANGEVMHELLKAGADINAQTEAYKFTALMEAVNSKNVYLVQDLLARGANPLLAMSKGWTAFDMAKMEGVPAAIKDMISAAISLQKTEGLT